jgi:polyisoprenoid-binding protein YceI
MRRARRPYPAFAIAALWAGCGLALAGQPVRYVIDPVHTRVMFEIDHAGFSKAIGTVAGSEGSLQFDADDWSTAQLDVTVPMQRLDMGDSDWSAAVFAPRFLDVRRFPRAHFVSTRVERLADNRGTACGELTLHGTTRPVCLQIRLNRIARYPLPPFRRTAGFSATATLKRSEFGMTAWQSLVGDDIDLRIEAELTRRDGDATGGAAPAPASH